MTIPARTVTDCFTYRNKIGIRIAVEALRDGWTRRRFTMDGIRPGNPILTEAAWGW